MELILKYFPDLTEEQKGQFAALYDLYTDWNSKINVISRKDIGNLYEHHVLHSLGIAKVIRFAPGTKIMDLGTGGGFPGIPLAILFPEVQFHLVDSIGKKVRVATEVAGSIVSVWQHRTEKRNHPSCTRRRRKATVRLRGEPCRNAPYRFIENHPQEYLPQTAERTAQRTYLPERRRTGERGDARQKQDYDVGLEGVLRGRVLRNKESGVRNSLKKESITVNIVS